MPLIIEQGAQYRMQGSESIVEVLWYEPGVEVRYHVIAPTPNAAIIKMQESEFRRYAIIEASGLTEQEELAQNKAIFDKHMMPVNLDTAQHLTEVQSDHAEGEAAASQAALDEIAAGGAPPDTTDGGNGNDTLAGRSGRDSRKGKKGKHDDEFGEHVGA